MLVNYRGLIEGNVEDEERELNEEKEVFLNVGELECASWGEHKLGHEGITSVAMTVLVYQSWSFCSLTDDRSIFSLSDPFLDFSYTIVLSTHVLINKNCWEYWALSIIVIIILFLPTGFLKLIFILTNWKLFSCEASF